MTPTQPGNSNFIETILGIIEDNISNESFGVSELAGATGMSRSNLLRKVKKLTGYSVSQYIRKVRLENAMEILKEGSHTVSEVSYKVGFNSSSYFVKCFHDHYGFPPGEVGKGKMDEENTPGSDSTRKKPGFIVASGIALIIIASILLIVINPFKSGSSNMEKSIAVLPFKNDSNDSTNIYIINGLMESILSNLQKVKDLRVISRTSVEKYRYAPMIIPEIAKELNVNYFVGGSGQKIGDEILLTIRLIEAKTDKHLWSEQYKREAKDIFQLQMDIARDIAEQIEAIITPEEEERISKVPTKNLEAYDEFLKGLDLLNDPAQNKLEDALAYFKKAISMDEEYARAYAAVAITYYILDKNLAEKRYTDLINTYADKALLYDSQLEQSLIAKALFYMTNGEYEFAVSYFEKALEYNPNSDLVLVFLIDLYANYFPDTEKYLEYALKGLRLNLAAYDSVTISMSYLHISNAFIQSGFVDEAEEYINKSLDYYPENIYSAYVKPYILYSKSRDLNEMKEMLLDVLKMDTTRLDVLQEVAKVYYYMRDYDSSYHYYKKLLDGRETYNLDIYQGENSKIAVVLSAMGFKEQSDKLLSDYKLMMENDRSLYKHLSLAVYYSYTGETGKAIEELRLFSNEDNYHYWTLLFLKIDPLVDNIRNNKEFEQILEDIDAKFWKYHKRVRFTLEKEGLILAE
jgi:TolB-like protein/AraC-like DNA-binding protein/Tfp pilus assembly protein PilF